MIYPLAGLILGAMFGAFRAHARGGNLADKLQWAGVFGIVFFVIGMFVLIYIERGAI